MANNYIDLPELSGGSGGVTSLNSLTGALSLTSSGGTITITPSGATINLETSGTFSGPIIAPNGSAAAPSFTFTGDTTTGLFLVASDELGITVSGSQAVDIVKNVGSPTTFNFGFGVAASGSSNTPFQAQTTVASPAYFIYTNTSNSTSSSTQFLIGNGSGSNYTTIENWASLVSGYLAGGSAIFASPNQTQLVIGAEQANSYIAFTVGGRTSATERMRLTSSYLTLPTGSSDPTAPAGSIYYNTSSNTIRFYNGTAWGPL